MHLYRVSLAADLRRSVVPSSDLHPRPGRRRRRCWRPEREAGNASPAAVVLVDRSASTAAADHRARVFAASAGLVLPGIHGLDPSDPAGPGSYTASWTATRRDRIEEPWTRSACGRPTRATRSSTRRSRPTCDRRCRRPGFPRRRHVQRRPFSSGAARVRRRLPGVAQRAFDEVTASLSAAVGGADPLDGVPPRGAAPRRRDAHPPGGDHRPPRPGLRRLVDRVDHGMEWPLKIVACKYDVVSRAWRSSTPRWSSPAAAAVQARPHRAAVPRRPHGPPTPATPC